MTVIHRRTLLRGMLGGAAVTIGLPPLERFFTGNGAAYAASCAPLPQRFGLFFWGNGVHPDAWVPKTEGPDFELPELMRSMAELKSKLTVVSNMNVMTGNQFAHTSGTSGVLAGAPLLGSGESHVWQTPTIDQQIAAGVGGDTRFRSLETSTERTEQGVSQAGPNSPVPVESSPARFFERVFGGGFTAPGEDRVEDPKLALRRSVLDAVLDDGKRLQASLGAADKVRLDQHLSGIRELERRVAQLQRDPPDLEACARPDAPEADYPDVEGRPQIREITRAMTDTLVMAMACDQTRVVSHLFNHSVSNMLFPGAPEGFHRMTHDEPGEQPEVRKVLHIIMEELAYFLTALDAVQEGDGTLLDHSVILCTTDGSFGRTHSVEDFPILLAGGACGRLKTGIHYRSPGAANVSHVGYSLLTTMGLNPPSFGLDAGKVTEGLSAIETGA